MNENALADALLAARAGACVLALPPGLDLPAAYRVAAAADARRRSAGEVPRGWKIGFTNRGIWPRYGVDRPIWARVWDGTLTLLEGCEAEVSLVRLVQPRIEPEIVFGFARTPEPGMDEAALVSCLEWVAHGIEIVHTHVAGWHFASAAEPVADFGLHGRLLVGPRRSPGRWADLGAELASLRLVLHRDGRECDRGQGAAVLDGPLSALRQWLEAMARQTPDVRVQPGECVTTGTITDAWPVVPGEAWTTVLDDARLPGLTIRFVA